MVKLTGVLGTLALLIVGALTGCASSKDAPRPTTASDLRVLRSQGLADLTPPGAVLLRQRAIGTCGGDSGNGPEVILQFSYQGHSGAIHSFYERELSVRGWRKSGERYRYDNNEPRATAQEFEKKVDAFDEPLAAILRTRPSERYELLLFGYRDCSVSD